MTDSTLTTLFPLLSMVAMLWILWSDSLRSRRSPAIVYIFRGVLFLAMAGVLLYNMFAYSRIFSAGSRSLVIATAVVGVVGASYFFRKPFAGRKSKRSGDPPAPGGSAGRFDG